MGNENETECRNATHRPLRKITPRRCSSARSGRSRPPWLARQSTSGHGTALSAIIHGYATKQSLAAIANCISILLAMHDIALWGEWVASKANVADIPTRTTMEDATAHPAILTWRPRIHECQSIPVQLINEPILMIARSKLN